MARFNKSNRAAEEDLAVINARRPGLVQGPSDPVSRRDFEHLVFHPTSG